jgi:hypothetical protein
MDDAAMASSEHAKDVLQILRSGFGCPHYCVKVTDDCRPRMTLLLLEHLNEITAGKMHTDIEEAKHFILEQASKAGWDEKMFNRSGNCQMEGIIYENGVPIRVCTKG